MAIIKLALGRENAVSGRVTGIEVEEGQYGPQYKVTFESGDVMYQNKEPFDRQLQYRKLTPPEMIGEEFTFWRKPMPGDASGTKGYFNIELGASGVPAAVAGAAAHATNGHAVAAGPKVTFDELASHYGKCLAMANVLAVEFQEATGREVATETVQDIASSLYIESNRKGAY